MRREDQDASFNLKKIDLKKTDGIIKLLPIGMNINKSALISIFIIVITLAIGVYLLLTKKDTLLSKKNSSDTSINSVQLKFGEKKFQLDYSSLSNDFVQNIAKFDKNEEWQGNPEFDDIIYWEGNSSLLLSSKDNEKVDAHLLKKIDLGKYQNIKFSVYLQTEPSDLESVSLYFANKDKTAYYSYQFTNLVKGWNFLDIPKIKFSATNAIRENLIKQNTAKADSSVTGMANKGTNLLTWNNIERVGLEINSRPNSTATLNFDLLTALESEDYLDDWLISNPLLLNLVKTNDDKIVLQSRGTALIKKLSGVSNFTVKGKLQPLKVGTRSGLFIKGDYKTGYGYYFLIDGIDGNRWQIIKYSLIEGKAVSETLKNGIINNFIIEDNKPLLLKVESRSSNMKFYLSTDNKSFTMLGEVNDGDIKEGGVGIAIYDGGATQFDEIEFTQ